MNAKFHPAERDKFKISFLLPPEFSILFSGPGPRFGFLPSLLTPNSSVLDSVRNCPPRPRARRPQKGSRPKKPAQDRQQTLSFDEP